MEYTVQSTDLDRLYPLVDDWNERAKQPYMGYYDALDALSEKFHTTKARIQSLNPTVAFNSIQAGAVLIVPAIQEGKPPKAASLKVDLGKKQILALDAEGKVLALFHCSIAQHVEKRPSGQTTVVDVHRDPDYTFDPKYWPEVHNVDHKLLISPGPRNPVGLAWVGLDLPGYGMHGTPHPEMIGKTGSHGCFRLTNWDAIRLSKMIRPGAIVTFVAP
jgi:lipoprotein-anchoring transpeptidase ErfK/SrfK